MKTDTLWSTVNTPEIEAKVRAAFEASDHCHEPRFRTVYEHGQWWVIQGPTWESDETEDRLFSVVDAIVNGEDVFDFEALQ
jgi:hypothetical protein